MRTIAIFIILLAITGCAGGSGTSTGNQPNAGMSFAISPSGPSPVVKGETLQLATDPVNLAVTWSVDGGDIQGTIDANGLYRAPDSIPLAAKVIVRANSDNAEATATIQIYTDEALQFGAPRQVSDTAINNLSLLSVVRIGISTSASADQLGVRSGSLSVASAWDNNKDPNTNQPFQPMTSVSQDLGGFQPEMNLTADTNKSQRVNCLINDQDQNPGIFFSDLGGSLSLLFRGSRDQGQSFEAPTQVVIPASGHRKYNASAKVDSNNRYHVVFVESVANAVLRFYQSDDQGKTWQTANTIPAPKTLQLGHTLPNLNVSEDGQKIHICYRETGAVDDEIYLIRSLDGGASFESPVNVSQAAGPEKGACRVASGPQGEIYVSYRQGETAHASPNENADILLKVSTDGGASFGLTKAVHPLLTGKDSFLPFMAVDALGRIDMVWADDQGANDYLPRRIYHSRSSDGGEHFTSEQIIVTPDKDYAFPMGLVHDEAGRLHLQYASQIDEGNFPYHVYHRMAH